MHSLPLNGKNWIARRICTFMKKIVLVTGGGRSGKSDYALTLTQPSQKKVFVATAEAFDGEMEKRIAQHRRDRDNGFSTIEEPIEIVEKMKSVAFCVDVILLDCLTVWMGNLMHYSLNIEAIHAKIDSLIDFLTEAPCRIIIVTNEVGMGIVPENATAREFRDLAGRLNQKVAVVADQVMLLVSGIPIRIK